MQPILIGVNRGVRQLPPHHGTSRDEKAKPDRDRLLSRGVSGVRCYYCSVGVNSIIGEVTNENGDHADLDKSNLHLGCPLCHNTQHLDLMASKLGDNAGKMIFLPEMSQGEVNALFWAIVHSSVYTRRSGVLSPEEQSLKKYDFSGLSIYIKLAKRANFVPEQIRTPDRFVQFLKKLTDEQYDARLQHIKNIRWLPPMEYYEDMAASIELSFSNLDLDSWIGLVGGI